MGVLVRLATTNRLRAGVRTVVRVVVVVLVVMPMRMVMLVVGPLSAAGACLLPAPLPLPLGALVVARSGRDPAPPLLGRPRLVHDEPAAHESAALPGLETNLQAWHADGRHGTGHHCGGNAGIDQRRHRHVTGDAGGWVQVQMKPLQ